MRASLARCSLLGVDWSRSNSLAKCHVDCISFQEHLARARSASNELRIHVRVASIIRSSCLSATFSQFFPTLFAAKIVHAKKCYQMRLPRALRTSFCVSFLCITSVNSRTVLFVIHRRPVTMILSVSEHVRAPVKAVLAICSVVFVWVSG